MHLGTSFRSHWQHFGVVQCTGNCHNTKACLFELHENVSRKQMKECVQKGIITFRTTPCAYWRLNPLESQLRLGTSSLGQAAATESVNSLRLKCKICVNCIQVSNKLICLYVAFVLFTHTHITQVIHIQIYFKTEVRKKPNEACHKNPILCHNLAWYVLLNIYT